MEEELNKDSVKAPFTEEQVKNLNEYQNMGMMHSFTCAYDGGRTHIKYEFEKKFPGQSFKEHYEEYLASQKTLGIPYPEMEFKETNLIATTDGWICPVCGYKQNWAHGFMAEKQEPLKWFPLAPPNDDPSKENEFTKK